MSTAPSRLTLVQAVEARLVADDGWLQVYLGRVPADDQVVKILDDPTGAVAAYAVIYPAGGHPTVEGTDLGDTSQDLDWGVQVTVAAGYLEQAIDAVDFVHGRLFRWRPDGGEGINTDGLVPPTGYEPGLIRVDDAVKPARFWLPLQYRLTATP